MTWFSLPVHQAGMTFSPMLQYPLEAAVEGITGAALFFLDYDLKLISRQQFLQEHHGSVR